MNEEASNVKPGSSELARPKLQDIEVAPGSVDIFASSRRRPVRSTEGPKILCTKLGSATIPCRAFPSVLTAKLTQRSQTHDMSLDAAAFCNPSAARRLGEGTARAARLGGPRGRFAHRCAGRSTGLQTKKKACLN